MRWVVISVCVWFAGCLLAFFAKVAHELLLAHIEQRRPDTMHLRSSIIPIVLIFPVMGLDSTLQIGRLWIKRHELGEVSFDHLVWLLKKRKAYRAFCAEVSPETWVRVIDTHPEFRETVSMKKGLPAAALDRLARDSSEEVRCNIAAKRRLPLELVTLLAGDTSEKVRYEIANGLRTPRDLLEKLAEDDSRLVSAAACVRLSEKEDAE